MEHIGGDRAKKKKILMMIEERNYCIFVYRKTSVCKFSSFLLESESDTRFRMTYECSWHCLVLCLLSRKLSFPANNLCYQVKALCLAPDG